MNMKRFILFVSVAVSLLLSSCASSNTRQSLYSKMYEEKPVVIVVMPPINNTTNVEAKELLYTSISFPLIEAGYYVISPHIAMELFKAESAYDSEQFVDQDAAMFAKVFGADAVVFSVINKWKKNGLGIETEIIYTVKSTITNEILFERDCDLYLDLQQHSGNNSPLGVLADLAATAITTAVTDHIVAARKCNAYIFSDIPRGKYHPDYMKDMDVSANPKDGKVTVK